MPRTDKSSHPALKAQPNTTARKRIQQRKPAMQRHVQQDDSVFKHGSQCKHISTCWRHASSSPKLHCTGPPPCVHHFWIMNAVPGSNLKTANQLSSLQLPSPAVRHKDRRDLSGNLCANLLRSTLQNWELPSHLWSVQGFVRISYLRKVRT